MENVRQYILALMKTGDFSQKDAADASTVPLETVRNFLSGRTVKNVGFATIAKLIVALGGDLNVAIGYEKKKEIEVNSTVSLKETYEMRISDLINSYEQRIEDIKQLCEMRIADVQKCCDVRITDLKNIFEERIKEQKDFYKNNNL